MRDHPRYSRLWNHLAVLFCYLGTAFLATLPLGLHLTTHLPDGMDTLVHYWNDWWIEHALQSGQPLYYTFHLFYPEGITLVYHNLSWVHIIPWLVLKPLVGAIAAYNAIFVGYLALCGLAFYSLAQEFIGDRRVAFVAGLIYQCWPHRLTHPSHPNYMSTWAIPLFVLFLARTVGQRRWRDGLLAGVFLVLAGYTCLQFLIPTALVGGCYLVLTLPRSLNRRTIRALVVAGAVTVIGLAPIVLVMVRGWRTTPADLVIEGEETTMQTDLLAYLTPQGVHPVFGEYTRPAYDRYYYDRDSRRSFSPYLGVMVLVLVVLGVCKTRLRDVLPWVIIALLLAWLALGPILRVNGQFYPRVPMLYNLAARSFLVRLIREPDRFNIFLALPISMLAAYGINYVLRTIARGPRWASTAVLCSTAGVIFFEYLVVPLPLQSGQLSSFYAELAAEPGDFAVLNIPVNPYKSKPYMFAQTIHQRPILQGHSSRYPEGAFRYLDSQPWLHAVRQYDDIPPRQRDISRQLGRLASDGVRYLIVHKDMMDQSRWAKWKRYLVVDPRFEDEDIAVYATAPRAGQDWRLDPELVPQFGVIRAVTSGTCLTAGLPLEVNVAWGTAAPLDRDLAVRLALEPEGGVESLAAVFSLFSGWPTSEWPANAVVWGDYTLDTRSVSSPGTYAVTLTLVDAEIGSPEGQPLTIGQVELGSAPCPLPDLPEDVVHAGALYGDVMQLLGYRLDRHEDVLTVSLYWRAVHHMAADYKVFVHVFDLSTAVPVAQDDAMPMQWRYPTTLWDPGEVVIDTISISLGGVPSGDYGVAVGIYDPGNMERLAVIDGSGLSQVDARLVLSGERVSVQEAKP